jgi:hypothetical protein
VNGDDDVQQQAIHDELTALFARDDDDEPQVLTGWVIAYESQRADGTAIAGHTYGPAGMTTWRALGLIEWARQNTLRPDDENGD